MIGEDASAPLEASRTSNANLPGEWRALYSEETKSNTGGIAFSSRKNASAFYRGFWIVQRTADSFERIEISRFGGLSTSVDRTLEGLWRMTGQDIFMRWDDGMRKVLSPVGQGFLLYEYKPGRPLDGVPTRIFSATPEDAAKLAAHMKGRQDVAEQMHSLAEAAGVTTSPDETGWGQTFMRWAWPFSENDQPQSTDALLQDEFEGSSTLDPWWWPFWSEKPTSEDTTEEESVSPDVATDSIEVPVAEPEAATTTETTPEEPKKVKKPKQSWKWPF